MSYKEAKKSLEKLMHEKQNQRARINAEIDHLQQSIKMLEEKIDEGVDSEE